MIDEAVQAIVRLEVAQVSGATLKQFAGYLAKGGQSQLCDAYSAILSHLAIRIRYQMLPELYMLSPVLVALGGAGALTETWRAIRDIYDWWP
jgi:hypothetical protein